jgi:hypothetical protein
MGQVLGLTELPLGGVDLGSAEPDFVGELDRTR